MRKPFLSPPVTVDSEGSERKAGYEFEFTGVEIDRAAELLQKLYGGEIHKLSTWESEVIDTQFGTFKLELDAQLLRNKKYERLLKKVGIDLSDHKDAESFEDSLKEMASSVVPFEIITPPVPLSEMGELEKLINHLRQMKAKGTGSSFLYAFGMHINPQIPDSTANSLLNHLRAYVMLDSWIRKDADINISRKLTPYINEYKDDYIRHILNPDYKPDLDQLIRDYFKYDNSRNRPLDMLPVFMHLNEDLTQSMIDENITSSRPTYHYRLPNCSLEDGSWSLASEWNRWVLVETLAADEQKLNQYSRAWLKMDRDSIFGFEKKWIKLMDRYKNEVQK